ncbi:MAG: hypothetical protein WDO73_28345 [Ignavibacteriota bacterium]
MNGTEGLHATGLAFDAQHRMWVGTINGPRLFVNGALLQDAVTSRIPGRDFGDDGGPRWQLLGGHPRGTVFFA